VVGETGRGKTRLTSLIAQALAAYGGPRGVAVLDFAPGKMGVGAPLKPPRGARYVRPRGLRAPRLESRGDCGAAWRMALENARLTSAALLDYIYSPLPALVINDATIHLHAGSPSLMLEALSLAKVAVVNAYLGSKLRDPCGIWEREVWAVSLLERAVDEVWRL
jgi:hypothetical protein